MPDKSHVVDIDVWILRLREKNGIIPESKIVDAVCRFGKCKKRFSIGTFDTNRKYDLSVMFNCTGIKCCVDSHPFHKDMDWFCNSNRNAKKRAYVLQ